MNEWIVDNLYIDNILINRKTLLVINSNKIIPSAIYLKHNAFITHSKQGFVYMGPVPTRTVKSFRNNYNLTNNYKITLSNSVYYSVENLGLFDAEFKVLALIVKDFLCNLKIEKEFHASFWIYNIKNNGLSCSGSEYDTLLINQDYLQRHQRIINNLIKKTNLKIYIISFKDFGIYDMNTLPKYYEDVIYDEKELNKEIKNNLLWNLRKMINFM